MTIEKLKSTNQLSLRGYNVCKSNNINSLIEIKEYYIRHGSFRELKDCGTEQIREFLRLLNFKKEIGTYGSVLDFQEEKNDFLLIEYLKKGVISRRTHNICRANGIDTLGELEIYYCQFETFRHLNGCGVKINNELLALLNQKYDKEQISSYDSNGNLSFQKKKDQEEELIVNYLNRDKISKRAFKICRNNGFETVSQLKAFYNQYKTFQFLPSCGTFINKELMALCRSYGKRRSVSQRKGMKNEVVKIETFLRSSDVVLHKPINQFIKKEYSRLTPSSQNSLYLFFKGKIFIPHINPIFDPAFKIGRIPKIRAHSVSELRIFIESIKDFVKKTIEDNSEIE